MTTAWVLVTARDCPDFLAECLASIEAQDYEPLQVVVVDDASTDKRQRDMVAALNERPGWIGDIRQERVGATANLWHAIHCLARPQPDDVILFVDGDDSLAGPGAVSTIMDEYAADPNLWVAYGSYVPDPPDVACEPASPYPLEVVRARSFRTSPIQRFNHTVSMRAFVANYMTGPDLCDDSGAWVMHAYDAAIVTSALELVGPCHRCLPDVTYRYRANNPDSCNRNNHDEMVRVGAELRNRSRKPRLYRDGTTFTLSDVERPEIIVDVMARHGLTLLIELGTGHLDVAEQVTKSGVVERVVTVEPDPDRYIAATERTIVNASVQTIHGERNDWLRRCSERVDRPACWFLAANAATLDELLLILARPAAGVGRDCVLIEDARLFGTAGFASLEEVRGQVRNLGAVAGRTYDVSVSLDLVHITPRGDA